MRANILTTLALLAAAGPAAASDRAAQAAVETVQAALDRGHGRMCSLANEPVASGGYWRCLDVPPYRFVAGYGRMSAFVVAEGQAPYPVLTSENGEAEFTARGRWMYDLAPRVTAWWNDEVLGERSLRESGEEGDRRHRRAEEEIERLSPTAPAQSPEPSPAPSGYAPQPYQQPYQQQPQPPQPAQAGAATDDLRSRPIPGGPAAVPPGGVQIAPGVVGYPNGVPGQQRAR